MPDRRTHRLLPAALLGLVTGCGGFDRGPAGVWDELASPALPAPPASPSTPGTGDVPREGATEAPLPFDSALVVGLPAPAQRFLLFSIAPGTPLASSVELRMTGSILLDPEGAPWSMEAEQILAPPRGFVWSARAQRGGMGIRGFDRYARGEGEMRWRLFGLIPVMRATGEDVTRSAAARLAMEAVLLPSVLVPGPSSGDRPPVHWEAVDDARARFVLTVGAETVRTTLEVDASGRPLRAWADRWNEGRYERFQVDLSGEFEAQGYRLPAQVEAGWRLGDADEFRFFEARLTSARFR